MDGNGTGDKGPILNLNVAAGQGAVGQDAVVAHLDIVAEMGGGHQVVVVTDNGLAVWLECPVNGHAFTEHVVVTDKDLAHRFRPGNMLRLSTDDGMLADLIMAAHADTRFDDRTAGDRAVIANRHTSLNRRKGRHCYANAEFGFRAHRGQRMDAHRMPAWR